jgi:hypothetical protein
MAAKLGMSCKLYRQTTGTRAAWPGSGAAPNLEEITNARDVTLNLEKGEADVTTRGNNGWRAMKSTLKDGSVEFEMVWDTSDDGFSALKDAFFNGTSIALAILDGASDTAGTEGLWADFEVMNFSRSEPLEEAVKANVTVKPTYSSVAAEWAVVA